MANPVIKIKRSAVPGKIPTTAGLELGELAINTYDGKVYIEQDQGGVGVGTTIITINPWSVGLGSTAYNTYFTTGSVGVGTTNPTSTLTVTGNALFNGTGVVTATKYYGDGSALTGITASNSSISIRSSGSLVGTASTIDFGSGLSVVFGSGIATVTAVTAGGGGSTARTITRSIATEGQTSFSVTYTVGYIDVYLNGSRLDSTEYTASNGTSVVLVDGASINDVLEFISYAPIYYVATAGIATYATSAGIATTATSASTAYGLSGTPNLNVGVVTASSFSGSGTNLTGIVTSIVAGTNISVSGSTGQVTINGTASIDLLEVILFA